MVACWPSGSALRVSTTGVHWHFNCSDPSVLRDGRILNVSTGPSTNHKRWLSKTRPRTWGECKRGALDGSAAIKDDDLVDEVDAQGDETVDDLIRRLLSQQGAEEDLGNWRVLQLRPDGKAVPVGALARKGG